MQIMRFLGKIAKTTLAIGALSVSAFAAADEVYPYHQDQMGCCPTQYCPTQCCTTPPCCPSSCCGCQCEPAPCCNWGYNPPAYLRCPGCCAPCGDGFFDTLGFRVDFLWWRPSTECIDLGDEEFVVNLPTVGGDETSIFNSSSTQRPNFKFDPGFRIGIAHVCPCDCWDAELNWTHFHSKARCDGETFGLPPTGIAGTYQLFIPYWERVFNPALGSIYPDFARERWNLNLDLLDLEFGYKYYVACCFALRPHAGLRGARINQHINIFQTADRTGDAAATAFGPPFTYTSTVHAKCNFLGLGPRLGLDLEIDLGCGLSIFGRAAGSLLFGRFERHGKEFYTQFSTVGTTTTTTSLEYSAHGSKLRTSRAVTDLAIGLKWAHCFNWCNRCHPVSFSLLWEHHGFYKMTCFNFISRGFDPFATTTPPVYPGSSKCGCEDLTTQGLTAALTIGF